MLTLLISLLVILVIGGLCYWALTQIASAFGLPPQVVVLLQVALVIILVILLLAQFSGVRIALP